MSSLERIVAPDVADARGLRTEALPQGSGAIITSAELSRRLDDPELTIVDVRPLPAYNGWRPDGAARGGHIPAAAEHISADNASSEEAREREQLAAVAFAGCFLGTVILSGQRCNSVWRRALLDTTRVGRLVAIDSERIPMLLHAVLALLAFLKPASLLRCIRRRCIAAALSFVTEGGNFRLSRDQRVFSLRVACVALADPLGAGRLGHCRLLASLNGLKDTDFRNARDCNALSLQGSFRRGFRVSRGEARIVRGRGSSQRFSEGPGREVMHAAP